MYPLRAIAAQAIARGYRHGARGRLAEAGPVLAGPARPGLDAADLHAEGARMQAGFFVFRADRTPGALDFQASPTENVARQEAEASLDQLMAAAELVEAGKPLPPALAQALFHGSSMGGARPKALITGEDRKMSAKFSATAWLGSPESASLKTA